MQQDNLKFLPNIPTPVTISFDQPKTGEGQYGTWYKYGCKHQGVDKVFFAAQGLQDRLSKIGALRNRQLTITKVVDYVNGREQTHWVIQENGQDITPSVNAQEAQGGAYEGQVVHTPQNEIKYQTMSDFEVKALAELNRLATGYEKLFNAVKTIELALPEEIRNAMQIHESDNQLENLQKVGLEPNSNIPVVEDTTEMPPF